jgi:hypothetical protein
MPKIILIGLLLLPAIEPARASDVFPITVPVECQELAQREGVPIVISNRYEATKAGVKLARLREADPMVRECREAVARTRLRTTQASK